MMEFKLFLKYNGKVFLSLSECAFWNVIAIVWKIPAHTARQVRQLPNSQ